MVLDVKPASLKWDFTPSGDSEILQMTNKVHYQLILMSTERSIYIVCCRVELVSEGYEIVWRGVVGRPP